MRKTDKERSYLFKQKLFEDVGVGLTPRSSFLILYEKGEDRKLNIPFLVHSKSSFVPCPQFSPLLVLSLCSTFLCPFQVLVCSFSSSFPCPCPQLFPSPHPFAVPYYYLPFPNPPFPPFSPLFPVLFILKERKNYVVQRLERDV